MDMPKRLLIVVLVIIISSSFVSAACYSVGDGCLMGDKSVLDDYCLIFDSDCDYQGDKYCVEGSCRNSVPDGYGCCEKFQFLAHLGGGRTNIGYTSWFTDPDSCPFETDSDYSIGLYYSDGRCVNFGACENHDDCLGYSLEYAEYDTCEINTDCDSGYCYFDHCTEATPTPNKQFCGETGFCEEISCDDDGDCPRDSICNNDYCDRVFDNDGDGLIGSVKSTGALVPLDIRRENPKLYDCNDGTRACAVLYADPLCLKDSDPPASDTPTDCWDYCIDKDGDFFCDYSDPAKTDTPSIRRDDWREFNRNDLYSSHLEGFWLMDMWSPGSGFSYVPEYLNRISLTEDRVWAMSDLEHIMPFDCDDSNYSINPGIKEDNLCNLVDDDCDGVVDECAPLIIEEEDCVLEALDISSTGSGLPGVGDASKPSYTMCERKEKQCVYGSGFSSCEVWDYDGDGFMNASFGCPLCTDCDDTNPDIYPGAPDNVPGPASADMNCNGVAGETLNSDTDTIPDIWDKCDDQGSGIGPVDAEGCWFSTSNGNLAESGWSS